MISKQEARAALDQSESAIRHSRELYGYSRSAPYCFIWGVSWLVGYLSQAFLPLSVAPWTWIVAIGGGAVACLFVGLSQRQRGSRVTQKVWLFVAVIYAFSFSLFAIFQPFAPMQIGAYWPLLSAAIYCSAGLWAGVRYVVVGLALAALTLFCFFHLKDQFYTAMALGGGGALILTGLWLRRA